MTIRATSFPGGSANHCAGLTSIIIIMLGTIVDGASEQLYTSEGHVC